MAAFDRSRWLKRIRSRLSRRGVVDEATHAREFAMVLSLEKVIDWAKTREITIEFIKISIARFHSGTRRVEVSTHLPVETQLHVLLHELGHFLIEEDGETSMLHRFPNGYYKVTNDLPGRGILHKVDVIAEEFEAWERGRRLAEDLGVALERSSYDQTRARYLQSYFKWALKRGRVSDGE